MSFAFGSSCSPLEPGKQQESRKIDARLQAQIEMQRQELAESRRILLEETCAYNRERAFSEARTAALEKEVTDLKSSVRAGAENHDRERREWELEKNELRSKNNSLQVCLSHPARIYSQHVTSRQDVFIVRFLP